jgi:enoyl-CoA hydratase
MADVRLDRDGNVRWLTLDAPHRRNALTLGMVDEIVDACQEIDDDPEAGAVVLRATGPVFCAGADLSVLRRVAEDPTEEEAAEGLSAVYSAFVRVGELKPPVVAVLAGDAVGAGVNLALAADLRVVTPESRLITGFLDLGVHPGGGHFTLMARAGGRFAATALSLFGEVVDGARAVELGLAWCTAPAEEVEQVAGAMAHRVARRPRLARAMTSSLREQLGPPGVPWTVALEAERARQMVSLRSSADLARRLWGSGTDGHS